MSLWHNTDGQQKLLLKIGFNAQLMLLLLWLLVLALLLVLNSPHFLHWLLLAALACCSSNCTTEPLQ